MQDLDIAKSAQLVPITDIAHNRLGIPSDAITTYGDDKAKLSLEYLASNKDANRGKLVLVTGVSPTPAGEGKTTTTIGLCDALNHIGVVSVACLREPSLGPNFGMKGGAHGGGYAQVAPMDDINLHFTGDLHAVTSAHNLLASMVDNHLYWGNELDLNPQTVFWRRVVDLNDRALRSIELKVRRRLTRTAGFDITAASELMAVLCLSENLMDLQDRLSRLIVATTQDGLFVKAEDLEARSALAVLLKDALAPNLVQSLENNPVFIHGGPFANIAHGCNSVIATRAALAHGDVVVTEAGFGADLGAEKFLNIKCRQSGLWPDAVVVVATVRALKMHGGVSSNELATPNPDAVERGLVNLLRHVENIRKFNLEPIVSINRFQGDTQEELDIVVERCKRNETVAAVADHWAHGGEGGIAIAEEVMRSLNKDSRAPSFSYPPEQDLETKIETIAREIYRADGVDFQHDTIGELDRITANGFGDLPVCIAKTQYSFSSDPKLLGAPEGYSLPVREVQLKAGAGFVVAICGSIMTMPGLPRRPAAVDLSLSESGEISGLF